LTVWSRVLSLQAAGQGSKRRDIGWLSPRLVGFQLWRAGSIGWPANAGRKPWLGFCAKWLNPDELGKLPAFAPERLETTTRFFINLVVLPLFIPALYGEKLKVLHAEIGPHVARSVAFFVAACRHDGVT